MGKIVKSNNPAFIGKTMLYRKKTDTAEIGGGWFSQATIHPASEVTNFKIIDPNEQYVATKGMGGTLGTAAVGGLLFGGVGAIVGGLAGGNKVQAFSKTHVALQFSNGDWVVVEYDTAAGTMIGPINKVIINAWQKRYAEKQISPFAA